MGKQHPEYGSPVEQEFTPATSRSEVFEQRHDPERVAFGRVRVRLGSGALASRWKAVARGSQVQTFTFDPDDFQIAGFDHPMARVFVDVELTEDGHVD